MSCCHREFYVDETGWTWGFQWSIGGTLLDLTGVPLVVEFIRPYGTVVKEKTLGITGGDGGTEGDEPNIVLTGLAGDLTDLSGKYNVSIYRTDTNQRFKQQVTVTIIPPPV